MSMKGKMMLCTAGLLAADCALLLAQELPGKGWWRALAIAAALAAFLLMTRREDIHGQRGRWFTYLLIFSALCAAKLWLLEAALLAGAAVMALKVLRCKDCGKRLSIFGDFETCPACGAEIR